MAIRLNQPKPHGQSLGTLEKMMNDASTRIKTERDGDQKTDVTAGDVEKWIKFNDELKSEKSWQATVRGIIDQQDGNWVPFQPRTLTIENGEVAVNMPSSIRIADGSGPGEVVALYAVNPNPIFKQKAELLIKFDSMLLAAANSLEESLPSLRDAVKQSGNDDGQFGKGELNSIKKLIRGIERSRENLWNMLAYRQQLASELAKMDPDTPDPKPTTDQILDQLVKGVNQEGNDYKYHSGWDHSIVLFHAAKLEQSEAHDFVTALDNQVGMSNDQKKGVLQAFYDNAGSDIAPLILGASGVEELNNLADKYGMNLDFNAVKDQGKIHPVG